MRRLLGGLAVLSSVLCGVVPGSAVALPGTTFVRCERFDEGAFSNAHCTQTVGAKRWRHVPFVGSTLLGVQAKTSESEEEEGSGLTLLHSVISGVSVEIQSTEMVGGGEVENSVEEATGVHRGKGSATLEYKNVTILKPAGKGCKVKTGEIKTNKVNLTSEGQGDHLKFEPSAGTALASFEVEGCAGSKALEALNGLYELSGTVVGTPEGATVAFTSAGTTAQGTLKLRGQVAGISGAPTLRARANTSESFKPLACTTFSTP